MALPAWVRPAVAIAGSAVAFALIVDPLGFPVAVAAAVLAAASGSRELTLRESWMLAVAVAAAMTVLFVGLLDQPFELVPFR